MVLKCKDGNIQKRSEEHTGQTGNKTKEIEEKEWDFSSVSAVLLLGK